MMRLLLSTVLIAAALSASDSRISLLESSLLKEPANLVRRLDLAQAQLERFRYTSEPALLVQAKSNIRIALEKEPENFIARKLEAFASLLAGEYPEALKLARALNKRVPDDVEIYGYLSTAYQALGRLKEAEHEADWMLRLRPQNRESMRRAADLREAFGDNEGALIMLNDLFKATPASETLERAWALARIARLTRPSNPERAAELAREALKLAPESREAASAVAGTRQPDSQKNPTQLARTYLSRMRETTDYGYLDRAQKLISMVLESDPENYDALLVQNEIDLFQHRFPAVAANSAKLAKRRPEDAINWATLGDAFMEMGQYDAAANAYQRMVDLRSDLMSYNRIGWYRYITGDMEGAIEMMQRAVKAGRPGHENTAWCLVELGNLYFKSGKLDQAESAFRMALEHFGGMHSAHAGLGRVHAARHDFPQAIASLKKAQSMAPLVEYAGALADLYDVTRDEQEKKKQLGQADLIATIEAASGQKANRQLGLIYANHQRRMTEALEVVEADLAVRKDVYTWDAYSWVLFRSGRIEQAAKASEQALRAGTPEPLFFYHAGRIAAARGELRKAAEMLKKALSLNAHFDPREAIAATQALAALEGKETSEIVSGKDPNRAPEALSRRR
jgi:tetratricopeptide (TPR) repeat protein